MRRALWILAGMALGACRDGAPPPAPSERLTATATATTPVDHVDTHELPEGTEAAFGLPIPRAMSVEQRFPDAVRARGDLPLDAVANYVRARVVADRVETGPAKTVFSQVTLRASPNRMLRVEVVRLADRTELLVRDVTRPPASDAVKPTDPWDKPGFDPKDRRADPSRFE